jgi:hypothetical protein
MINTQCYWSLNYDVDPGSLYKKARSCTNSDNTIIRKCKKDIIRIQENKVLTSYWLVA